MSSFLGIFAFISSLHFWCCIFCSVCLSPLLSLLRWVALCVLAAGHHFWWSGCNFGVLSGAPSCLSLTFLHLVYLSVRMATKFVSHHSGLVAVYMQRLGFWGFTGVGVRVGALPLVPVYVCGVFSVAAELCILSSCWGCGRLLLSLFWCGCSALFPGAPAVFLCVSCSWLPFFGSTPCCLRLAALLLWWAFSLGLGVSWCRCLDSPLSFYLVPAQLPLSLLPLWGSAPLSGVSACLSPVCWSTPGVGLVGSLLRHLVFSHIPCSSSGPAVCAAFPAAGYLGFFSGHQVSVLQLPWWRGLGFSPSLLFLGFSCSACLLG